LIIVDSSVLIGLLRGHNSPPIERLQRLEEEEIPFMLPIVCYQEILQGAKDQREWNVLSEYLGSQDLLLPEDQFATHRGAARIYFDCREKG
jgi:predicted nucleic acid-binding protein